MILDPALGDVVQEQGDVEHGAVRRLDGAHQFAGEREFLVAAALDLGQHPDAAQQVLVHGVMVVHVELHHRHDAAEVGNEMPEHAGFVHAAEHGFGMAAGGENLEEQPVGLGILAQLRVDQLERARGGVQRVGMERERVAIGEMEDADQVDRIAAKNVGVADVDAVVVDDEVRALAQATPAARPQPRHHPAEHRRGLGLARLQARAQDRGEIADVLGDQKIMLHEPLDVFQPRMLGVAQPHRDLALDVERQPLLGAAGEEMHVAAHRPQEIPAAAENSVFLLVEHAVLKQLLGFAHAIDVFGDPEQRVQIAQAAFAFLHVRFDQIARLTGAAQALLAFGKLGGDEFRRAVLDDVAVEAGDELVVELAVAEQIAGLQHRGADRHVGLGLADAFVDRAGGVADLQAHVPQAIENRLGDRFAPGGLLVRQQEQEIDVGARRQ